jgi:hypothetical protein
MKMLHSAFTYCSEPFDDPDSGSAGVRLLATKQAITTCVAKITFWDASGQFFLEMTGPEVPLVVIEALIAEAKLQIPTA